LTIRAPIDIRNAALTVIAVIAIVLTLQYAQAMIIPIVLGVLLSYALEPVVAWMERWRIPRALAAAVVLIALIISCSWLVYGLRSEANAMVEQLPEAAKRVRRLVENDRPTTTSAIQQILSEIDRQIEMFLIVEAFTSTIVALATWLALRALGVEQAAVWGILAGVFNSIPYFGPVLVTGGTALVAFMQFGNIHMAFVVSGVSLAITSLEGLLLTPWLTSRAARMNAVAIFVGLLFWGWVWNVWGMLLAVPMLMVLKAIGDHVEDFHALGELLGE
jgi:predicted PurR-regulated permease PerM